MGALGSAFGLLGLVSYIIGGILADKFSAKKLLVFSLISTGIGGFAHLLFSSFHALLIIYGFWGVTSLLSFWPALMKIIRMQGNDNEQSSVYGLFEGGRGVASALHMAIATAIFGVFQAKSLAFMGLNFIIVFYSLASILSGVVFIFILKETKMDEINSTNTYKFSMKDFINTLKMPEIWFVVIITFCTYTYNLSFYYFTPYATNIIGTSAVFGAIITVIAQYCRPVASTSGGFLADRFGRAKVMFIGFIIMILATLLLMTSSFVPTNLQIIILIAASIIIYFGMYSNFGIYFSLLSEAKIPINISGMAIGIVATVGYLPEVLVPLVAGKILDTYDGAKGYNIYFSIMCILAFIGALFCLVWIKYHNAKNKIVNVGMIENN